MDPSEYEGTVERQEGALDAGALETLLDPASKFKKVDLSKEIDDLHLSIYSLKESLTKYEELSVESLALEMGEQIKKLAEMKEDYGKRRKLLTAKVKKFTVENLGELAHEQEVDVSTADLYTRLKHESKELIATFKTEFDFLSSLGKFAEAAFIASTKALRDLPDPATVVADSLQVSVKAHEGLMSAQEQLNIADEIISNPTSGAGPSAAAAAAMTAKLQAEMEALKAEELQRREDLKQEYLNEIVNIRSQFNLDLRTQEFNLTSKFESQQHTAQEQFEKQLAKKGSELESISHTLRSLQNQNMESEVRAGVLDTEMTKRRELEDKWRTALVEIADLNASNQDMSNKLDRASKTTEQLRSELVTMHKDAEKQDQANRTRIQSLDRKADKLTEELSMRPPVDLSHLLDTIGSIGSSGAGSLGDPSSALHHRWVNLSAAAATGGGIGADSSIEAVSRRSGDPVGGGHAVSWADVEALLVESLRKCDADATHSRVKEQEASINMEKVRLECQQLNEQLAKYTSLAESLEQDLLQAHQALEASNAALKKQQQQGITFRKKKSNHHHQQQQRYNEEEVVYEEHSSSSSNSNSDGGGITNLSSSHLEALLESDDNATALSHVDYANTAAVLADHNNNNTLAATGNQYGGASVGIDSNNGSLTADPKTSIFQAVQNQRDRYMRALRDSEGEVATTKAKFDRLQDEQMQLRNENLELYRRLRVLRVTGSAAVASTGGDSGASSAHMRSRKAIANDMLGSAARSDDEEEGIFTTGSYNNNSSSGGGGSTSSNINNSSSSRVEQQRGGGDALDRKYMTLYEAEISPFNVHELDKQAVLARLNMFERALAYINRNVMQDRWARHALMVYLALLHIFALSYVWQVLNPQLIEEVDAHLKAKWSAQTFNQPEHPDI